MTLVSTCGNRAEVDTEDFGALSKLDWFLTDKGYFATMIGGKKIRLHRLVLNTSTAVDHIDQDKANNRRNNLRPATTTQNNQNRGLLGSNTTGFKGVSRDRKRYTAAIDANGKRKYLGSFKSAPDAAAAYDAAALILHGDFACTNAALGLL